MQEKNLSSLSKRLGLGNKEPMVSAVIAEAFNGPQAEDFLASLLGRSKSGLIVLAAESEMAVSGSRFDVVVVYEDEDDIVPLVIEVKVSALESQEQIRRYQEVSETPAFMKEVTRMLPSSHIDRPDRPKREAQVMLLTVGRPAASSDEPDESDDSKSLQRAFGPWHTNLSSEHPELRQVAAREIEEAKHSWRGPLATLLLLDLLDYLGGELAGQRMLIEKISQNSLKDISEIWDQEALTSKLLQQAVLDEIREEFNELNETAQPPFSKWWEYVGGGGHLELGYYQASWVRSYVSAVDGETQKVRAVLRLRPNLGKLRAKDPSVSVTTRISVEPYMTKSALEDRFEEDQVHEFFTLRDDFARELASDVDREHGYKQQGYYLQTGEMIVRLEREETLKQAAQKLWKASELLAAATSKTLDKLTVGSEKLDAAEDDSGDRAAFQKDWPDEDKS